MSFVTTITSSLVRMSRVGYKIGKRTTKLAQLNLTLKVEREKLQACYQEIGEHVHHDKITEVSSSPKIKMLREKITLQERQIARLVEEINQLKRINSCSYCGHISGEESKYCPKCSRPRK